MIYGRQDSPGPDQDPAGLCKAQEHQGQEKPPLPQGTATLKPPQPHPGQGHGTETEQKNWSIPKNAGSSFSCDPEAKSLPRSSQGSALPPCSTLLHSVPQLFPAAGRVWEVPGKALETFLMCPSTPRCWRCFILPDPTPAQREPRTGGESHGAGIGIRGTKGPLQPRKIPFHTHQHLPHFPLSLSPTTTVLGPGTGSKGLNPGVCPSEPPAPEFPFSQNLQFGGAWRSQFLSCPALPWMIPECFSTPRCLGMLWDPSGNKEKSPRILNPPGNPTATQGHQLLLS